MDWKDDMRQLLADPLPNPLEVAKRRANHRRASGEGHTPCADQHPDSPDQQSADHARKNIQTALKTQLRYAVSSVLSENKQISSNEHGSPIADLYLLRDVVSMPVEERVKRKVRGSYQAYLKKYEEDSRCPTGLTREAFLSLYKEMAAEYFPFLREPEVSCNPQSVDGLAESGISLQEYETFRDTAIGISLDGAPPEAVDALKALILCSPAMRGVVNCIRSVAVDGDTVRVGFAPRDEMSKAVLEKKQAAVEAAFSEAYGRKMRVVLQRA